MDFEYLAIVLGVILFSMTLHEAMHGYAAFFLGDDTAKAQGRLTLNPIKHIDPFLTIILPLVLAMSGAPIFGGAKPVPFNPSRLKGGEWGVALVALAGPLTNLVLAFISYGVLAVMSRESTVAFSIHGDLISTGLVLSVVVNLGFFAFNMLPLPPLDGSRFMYALAPEFVRRGMESIERYGIVVVFLIVFVASPFISQYIVFVTTVVTRGFSILFGVS